VTEMGKAKFLGLLLSSGVLSGIVGAFLSAFVTIKTIEMQFKEAQYEKRVDEQRQDLRSLQEKLNEELTAVRSLVRAKDRCNEASPTMGWIECGDDNEFFRVAGEVNVFRVRAWDERIGELSRNLDQLCHKATLSKNKKEALAEIYSADKVHQEVNRRIGTVLGTQYAPTVG
jgi:hypothetical protein